MQESCFPDLDASPSDDEILQAVNKIHPLSLGASGMHARLWQALSSTTEGFAFIRHFVIHLTTFGLQNSSCGMENGFTLYFA